MKKVIVIYLVSIIALFFLPICMIKEYDIDENKNAENPKTIKLLLSETNQVIEMTLDEYIMGVIVGEMPVNYEIEALKAQAIVARTYTLNKIINSESPHDTADMCDDINHCQAYKTKEYALAAWDDSNENDKWDKIKKAVLETSNVVITYDDELINAFFHSNSGGKTEDISNIWGHENIPYLRSVESPEKELIFESVWMSVKELEKIMREKYENYISFEGDKYIEIIELNSSGRVSKVKISNIILDGTEARDLFRLRSTFFSVKQEEENIIFETKGYGHGIGMSQYGANEMAIRRKNV